MKWSRPEQVVVLVAVAAVLAGCVALLVVRRPVPPIRIIEQPPQSAFIVQVDGAVARPGMYRLPVGARVSDALAAAGGPAAGGDLAMLNLARVLRDGERVTIPRAGVVPPQSGDQMRLDLNAATAADLDRLPGIGPVLAQRIASYRARHGPFQRLEDLLQVDGVGTKLLERLRDQVVIR